MIIDAIVLAGGRASRLGGASKPELVVGGRTLLDSALDATAQAGARTTVVVGPVPAPSRPPGVLTTVEDPPFGGPVAGIAAGLEMLPPELPPGSPAGSPAGDGWVLVLAVDVPRLAEAVPLLLDRLGAGDGVHLRDREGRAQWLTGVYRRTALDAALLRLGEVRGASVGRLVGGLTLIPVDDDEDLSGDVDTWGDLDRARARSAGDQGGP